MQSHNIELPINIKYFVCKFSNKCKSDTSLCPSLILISKIEHGSEFQDSEA